MKHSFLALLALCIAAPVAAQVPTPSDTPTDRPPPQPTEEADRPSEEAEAPPEDSGALSEEDAADMEACKLCGFFTSIGLEELDHGWADVEQWLRGDEDDRPERAEAGRALENFRTRREAFSVRYGALEDPTPEDRAAAQREYDELRADLLRTRYAVADRAGFDRLVVEGFLSHDSTVTDLRARFDSAPAGERAEYALELIRLRRQGDALSVQHRALRAAARRRSDAEYRALRQALTTNLVSYDQAVRRSAPGTTEADDPRTGGAPGTPGQRQGGG